MTTSDARKRLDESIDRLERVDTSGLQRGLKRLSEQMREAEPARREAIARAFAAVGRSFTTPTHAINPDTGEFTRLDQEDTMTDHRAEAERLLVFADSPASQVEGVERVIAGAQVHALLAILDTLKDIAGNTAEQHAVLTEIRDRLPERETEPEGITCMTCGASLEAGDPLDCRLHAVPVPHPADDDPDEALIDQMVDVIFGDAALSHEGLIEARREIAANAIRAAREHIEAEPDQALRFIHPDAYDRERKWHGEQRVRAEKAEADLARVTEERDALRVRVDALRADVDEFQYKHRAYPGTWELVDALARDTLHAMGEQR